MSRYQPYPSYKESGVEWLGEVPEHWDILKIKYYGIYRSGDFISAEHIEDEDQYPVFGGNGLRGYTSNYNLDGEYVLIGRQGALCGNINYAKDKFWATEHAIVVRHYSNIHVKYLGEFLRVMNLNQYSVSAAQPGLAVENIINQIGVRPPLQEQIIIAKYIDIQTVKIDTLIAKQERMIELLGEKRSAMISHAVTKGIDSDVAMKDSGVEWLGEIPKHWEIKKLKYNLVLQTQKVTIDGHNVIALENIESKSGKYVTTESSYQGEDVEFKVGDILFGKLRPYLAKVYRCNSNGVAFGDLLTYRPTEYFASSFAFYSLLSEAFIRIVDSSTYGAKMPRASSEFINEMLLATPPLSEQIVIAEHLDIQTAKIDTLIAKARQAIELMKERRTALISAVVTGKIDVRGIV